MKKFVQITVGASGTGETLVDALAGLGERRRVIKSLRYARGAYATPGTPFQESTGTRIRAYKNQEQLVDYPITSFEWGVFSNTVYVEKAEPLLLDTVLERGDGLKVGFFNSSATPVGNITLEYDETE